MIDAGVIVEYLKPEIWTNLGVVVAPLTGSGKVLHILQMEDGSCKAICSGRQFLDQDCSIDGNGVNVNLIFEKYCDIIEIRVYTISGLMSYYREIQKQPVYKREIDEYLISLYRSQENSEGIKVYKRNPNAPRCRLEILAALFDRQVSQESVVVFVWLTDRNKLFFNSILEFSGRRLKRISTSDRYEEAEEKYEVIMERIREEFRCMVVPVRMELDEYIARVKQLNGSRL